MTRYQKTAVFKAVSTALAAAAIAVAGCGSGDTESRSRDQKVTRKGDPLAQIRAESDRILDGGLTAYKKRITDLKGYPIVVNKWASWCGPCRVEFPFFAAAAGKYRNRVAFLGVNSHDSAGQAATFLKQDPVGYPSYRDPDGEIERYIKTGQGFPATVFYSKSGKIVKVHIGGYANREQLESEIRRYTG